MKTLVMLDLENTVIESWFEPFPLMDKIRQIHTSLRIREIQDFELGIFSFAVDKPEEREYALQLASLSGMPLKVDALVPTFPEMTNIAATKLNAYGLKSLPKSEVVSLLGKDFMFPLWAETVSHEFDRVVLFDDALRHETTTIVRFNRGRKQTLEMIKVV